MIPASVPAAPVLNPITPSPNTSGTVVLSWNAVPAVTSYNIYYSGSNITSISGITPIANSNTTSFIFYNLEAGMYFFVVTAVNASGESQISNSEGVTVSSPSTPGFPVESVLVIVIVAIMGEILSLRLHSKKLTHT
jgi:predicted phage tail protein